MASARFSKDFGSARLLYRAVEDSEEDKAFIHNALDNDPTSQAMVSMSLTRPMSKKNAETHIKALQDCLLAVIICLRPQESEKGSPPAGEAQTPDPAPKEAKPVPIGRLALSCHRGGGDSAFSRHRAAMLGISLIDGFSGKGYGTEAIKWGLDWAFEHAGLHRICLCVFSYNTRAIELYRKLGFVEEGREREAVFYCRNWHDILLFSMLEHEWEKLRGIS
ncbi:Acyl-CoA N-acyltransferase [Penicillium lividum]|nr:Acyl-CoA N-acyltransferase [Penicillium lividum]